MTIFVDTSAFFALLDQDELHHEAAAKRAAALFAADATPVTSNYVIVECCALLQRRIGLQAVRDFRDRLLPAMEVLWVTERQHEMALAALMRAGRTKLSLVDCVSFEMMRERGIEHAFAFDRHFIDEGFDCDL